MEDISRTYTLFSGQQWYTSLMKIRIPKFAPDVGTCPIPFQREQPECTSVTCPESPSGKEQAVYFISIYVLTCYGVLY